MPIKNYFPVFHKLKNGAYSYVWTDKCEKLLPKHYKARCLEFMLREPRPVHWKPDTRKYCYDKHGTLYVMLKDAKGALEDFKAAIKLSPYSAHMYMNRGNLYASTQQFEKAEKDFTKALELNADDPLVLKRRADVRGKLGKKKEAVQDYRQAIELQGRIKYLKTGK